MLLSPDNTMNRNDGQHIVQEGRATLRLTRIVNGGGEEEKQMYIMAELHSYGW